MSRPSSFNSQGIAICSRGQAEKLAEYDHHKVTVDGKPAILLTEEWLPLEEHRGPFILTIIFHQVDQHPEAPSEIQGIVNELKFQFRSQPR